MSFDALRARFQTKFSFPLSLERPYKLRDYRPAYGFLLEEELRGYDFWGCCDVDMMFGDIGVFITEDMLSRYDQIGRMGHFSLYRNTPEINLLFTAAAGRRSHTAGSLRRKKTVCLTSGARRESATCSARRGSPPATWTVSRISPRTTAIFEPQCSSRKNSGGPTGRKTVWAAGTGGGPS